MDKLADQEILILQAEIEALRFANDALQQQMLADAESTDALLCEMEAQRDALRVADKQHQSLSSFVQRVMDTAGGLLIVLNREGHVRLTNQRCNEALGRDRLLPGAILDELLHVDDRNAVSALLPPLPWPVYSPLFELIHQHGHYHAEYRLANKDGSYRSYFFDANVLYNPQGKEEGAVISATDITDRQRILTELSESNRSLEAAKKEAVQSLAIMQSILDTAPVGIYLLDSQLRHIHFNKKYLQIMGYSSDELMGHTNLRFFPSMAEFEKFIESVAKTLSAGKTFSDERQMLHRDGSLKWIYTQINAVDPTNPGKGVVVAGEDISDRKKYEQELKESHAQIELTLHDLRAAQTQLIQAEKMASLGHLVANVAHEINTPMGAVKSSGQSIADELIPVTKSLPLLGKMLNEDSLGLFLKLIDYAHKPAKILSTRETRAIVGTTTQQLEAAGIDDARRKAGILVKMHAQSALTDFLPLLNHPACESLLDCASGVASIVGSAHNINTAVERVSRIVFALKAFISADDMGEMVDAHLQEGIEAVLTLYQSQIQQGTELVRNYEDLPPLWCIQEDLKQVWAHLIHNALHAMGQKGTLTVGLCRVVDKAVDEAVVSVKDNGCGIADEIRAKIFDAFFTTRAPGEGSGLGLSIVKKIVDKHQGRIEVQSEVGVGTTISVHLPYATANHNSAIR